MDDSLPSYHLLKDPLACKPRSEGPGEAGLSGRLIKATNQDA